MKVRNPNRNHQRWVRTTTGYFDDGGATTEEIIELQCDLCMAKYGGVLSHFYHKKCPDCQGGTPGLDTSKAKTREWSLDLGPVIKVEPAPFCREDGSDHGRGDTDD